MEASLFPYPSLLRCLMCRLNLAAVRLQFIEKFGHFGVGNDARIGPAFKHKAPILECMYLSADALFLLQNDAIHAAFAQRVGGCEARETCTDDDGVMEWLHRRQGLSLNKSDVPIVNGLPCCA